MLNCTDFWPALPYMTSIQDTRFDRDDAERLLTALAGVISAHVVTDDGGGLIEIHVLATSELHPKQVVRNIESALSAGLGIQVDRRIVSVAQIRADTNGAMDRDEDVPPPDLPVPLGDGAREPAPEAPSEEALTRLEFVRYEARRLDDRCHCDVVLRDGDEEIVGSGSGPDTPGGRAEAAARAVLDAVSRLRSGVDLRLEGAVIARARGRRFMIVSARALLDRATVHLSGAASLQNSPEEAAILASLQASNRWSG
jgi:hypothetical protein